MFLFYEKEFVILEEHINYVHLKLRAIFQVTKTWRFTLKYSAQKSVTLRGQRQNLGTQYSETGKIQY